MLHTKKKEYEGKEHKRIEISEKNGRQMNIIGSTKKKIQFYCNQKK